MKPQLLLPARVGAFLVYFTALYLVLVWLTGRWLPTNGEEDLWFACAVGYLAYSLFDTPFFVPPSQVLASGLPAALLLLSLDLRGVVLLRIPLECLRWTGFGAASLATAAACLAIGLRNVDRIGSPRTALAERVAYRTATTLGRGAVMFTPPALISAVGFHQTNLSDLLWITVLWLVLVALQPVELVLEFVKDVGRLRVSGREAQQVGEIQRVDSPNVVRVILKPDHAWRRDNAHLGALADGRQVHILPLFTQTQGAALVGTGLIHEEGAAALANAKPGGVYALRDRPDVRRILKSLSGSGDCELIGFVVEDSHISGIQFEVASELELSAGKLVFCRQGTSAVFYQILDARTREESFERNPRGTHVVTATQLGMLDNARGFARYPWLPEMNSPVFLRTGDMESTAAPDPPAGTFALGTVPRSGIRVHARFKDLSEYHTAILGVTGTGKTEMAFDIIRQGAAEGAKVFCVDFTGEYGPRLEDLKPVSLGFTTARMTELQQLVAAIETGQYKSETEKKKLEEWEKAVRPEVAAAVKAFLDGEGAGLGLFDLPDIANTRATLRATELYLSAIFEWARQNRKRRKILVVLEEAHTVIPEIGLFSFDKGETQSVVGRIAQIALQGRKYGVGLLLVSQRTALVSKTLLSQCNTFLVFALHDKTSLDYLQSVFGQDHVNAMPRLPFRHGIAFGKGILSDTPVLFEVPDDPAKRKASEELDKKP